VLDYFGKYLSLKLTRNIFKFLVRFKFIHKIIMKNFITRRIFLKKTSKGIVGAAVVSAVGYNLDINSKGLPSTQKAAKNKSLVAKTVEFGIEGSAPREAEALDIFMKAASDLGAGFIVCQFSPERINPGARPNRGWEASEKGFGDLALACKKYNMTYFANQEFTNYSKEGDILDKDGNDILAHPDKTHRWDITGKTLEIATKNPEFRGVMYDEAEHGQMRRELNTNGGSDSNATHAIHPYFAATDGMTLEQAYDAVFNSAKAVAGNYRSKGVIPMTEEVFPAMIFTFARAGFDIAVKAMKESIDPVYAAITMGATKQYGREFCITPDMWGFDFTQSDHFPGHPPEELRATLLNAYWIGATRIFVENTRGLIEKKTENGVDRYEPTEYGKVYKWFVKEYVPAHPRPYTFMDIRPEVAILRFDDSDWGQKESRFTDNLYGAVNLQTTPATEAWFQIWTLLTHGQTRDGAISFNSKKYIGVPHNFFYPLKDVIVYDHLAGEKELEGLKLVFLTGVLISPQTMKAVRAFVKKGGLCISLASLAPADLAGKSGMISEGSGHWLVVKDFLSDDVSKAVTPFLGKPDEISYHIGKQRLTVKRGKDSDTISVYLQNDNNIAKNGETSESARVW
jgi:hypothetical protein